MNWKEHIAIDSDILVGKPVIKGTRISLELIIERLADGWSEQDLLKNYPRLRKKDIQAVFVYIQECVQDGLLINCQPKSA